MKTIKQWLKEGLSKKDYKKAKKYRNERWGWEEGSFKDALVYAFDFAETEEGDYYWSKIYNDGGSINTSNTKQNENS